MGLGDVREGAQVGVRNHVVKESSLQRAFSHASRHRASINASSLCGCFFCKSLFHPIAITDWIETGITALCPKCRTPSVIGSASGFIITEAFLEEMRQRWFATPTKEEDS